MTPTETTTLADFLLATIAEDEAVARTAKGEDPPYSSLGFLAGSALSEGDRIVAHPARVLAECETKRRIVERCLEDTDPDPEWLNVGVSPEHLLGADVLKLLALPLADHPDYREEWKP